MYLSLNFLQVLVSEDIDCKISTLRLIPLHMCHHPGGYLILLVSLWMLSSAAFLTGIKQVLTSYDLGINTNTRTTSSEPLPMLMAITSIETLLNCIYVLFYIAIL